MEADQSADFLGDHKLVSIVNNLDYDAPFNFGQDRSCLRLNSSGRLLLGCLARGAFRVRHWYIFFPRRFSFLPRDQLLV